MTTFKNEGLHIKFRYFPPNFSWKKLEVSLLGPPVCGDTISWGRVGTTPWSPAHQCPRLACTRHWPPLHGLGSQLSLWSSPFSPSVPPVTVLTLCCYLCAPSHLVCAGLRAAGLSLHFWLLRTNWHIVGVQSVNTLIVELNIWGLGQNSFAQLGLRSQPSARLHCGLL